MAEPKVRQVSLWPLLGYVCSIPRQLVPFAAFTGNSLNWLVGNQRLLRRSGVTTIKNGLLESKWGALARRIYAATLGSVTDGYPAPLVLFVNQTIKAATICFRSTNTTPAEWRTPAQEFSAHHYPATGVPNHRVLPLVYRNQYGGLTLHRMNTAEHRSHYAAGSRDVLQVGKQVCTPGFDAEPTQWDGGFNHDDSTDVPYNIKPMGMQQPLTMPICTPGTKLTSGVGPFKGSSAFFFSMLFENSKRELSMFTIPRPPGSAWPGYAGFGYMQVDSAHPTDYYDSVVLSFIEEGPPDTTRKYLLISDVVDTATTGAGALVQPAIGNMVLLDIIPQGQTTYVITNSNTVGLDPDPRITEMVKGLLQWPPCARAIGRFDGHVYLGNLRPNPNALMLAPWESGERNRQIDDVLLYGADSYFAAITQDSLILRKVTGGAATDTTISLPGKTLRKLVDTINADATVATNTQANCLFTKGKYGISKTGASIAGVQVGDTVVNANWPAGTRVTEVYIAGGFTAVHCDNRPTVTVGAPGQDVVFVRDTAGTDIKWAAGVVPGADADESCESLLRTYVEATATYGAADTTLAVSAYDAAYITPGMLVLDSDFDTGTVVTDVTGTTVTVSKASIHTVHSGTDIKFAYDTGDTTLALLPGFVRCFAPSFRGLFKWSKAYLDRFDDSPQDATFSAASPGYAQDALNTWKVSNRRSGPASFGELMGPVDMGPLAVQLFSRASMRLWNQRTGLTHSDEDYFSTTSTWRRGARSPYAIGSGNGWLIYPSDEGFFARGIQLEISNYPGSIVSSDTSDNLISKNIYDAERPEGHRGVLEYAITACIASSESGSDHYPLSASIEGGVLYVRYWSSAAAGDFDREIRYDFSMGSGRTGVAEVLQDNGEPYPWSCPLDISVACSAKMPGADGLVHHYGISNGNTGTTDGCFVEINADDTDDGVAVGAEGYSGLAYSQGLALVSANVLRAVMSKLPTTGVTIGVQLNPESDPADGNARFADYPIGDDSMDAFGRSVVRTDAEGARGVAALAVRIVDDGSGPPSEMTQVKVDVVDTASVGNQR